MIIKKVWKNRSNSQLLVTIPNWLNIKEGDNVKIVKTEQPVSNKKDLIKDYISFILKDGKKVDKAYFYSKLQKITTQRVIDSVISDMVNEKLINKERFENTFYYSII